MMAAAGCTAASPVQHAHLSLMTGHQPGLFREQVPLKAHVGLSYTVCWSLVQGLLGVNACNGVGMFMSVLSSIVCVDILVQIV